AIYFARSTDHGVTFSSPVKLTGGNALKDLQGPDITVTGSGTVYLTLRSFAANGQSTDALYIVKSTDCGRTFGNPQQLTTFIRGDAPDQSDPVDSSIPQSEPDDPGVEDEGGDAPGSSSRDCGDFA